jgi:glucosamine-6-phosphate deaminase
VPDLRKAKAVRDALEGAISTACPASLVRIHPNATVYLDAASASLLTLGNR